MRLSESTLHQVSDGIERPHYDRSQLGIGIVHFGPGAFTRAHQCVFTDAAISKSGGDWGICAVALNSPRSRTALKPQDGLYTVAVMGDEPTYRVIGALKEILFAKEDHDAVMTRLCAGDTHFVTLTITEKGYALDANKALDLSNPDIHHDIEHPDMPVSAMGFIVLATERRLDKGLSPLCIISCDNLPDNGDRLRQACATLAATNGSSRAVLDLIQNKMHFPNTMVDSITPATTSHMLDTVEAVLSLRDEGAVQREAFAQWVIQDDLPKKHPNWAAAGVTITDHVKGYETTKLRILNGAHTALTYLGLLAGHETIKDAVSDPALRQFVDTMIREETIPTIKAPPELDLAIYWERTLERFDNPHIVHQLEQISHDGSQKIPARILPTILHHGTKARHALYVLAAWITWTRQRRAQGHPPTDDFLGRNLGTLPDPLDCAEEYASKMLCAEVIIPVEIASITGLVDTVIRDALSLDTKGVIQALGDLS